MKKKRLSKRLRSKHLIKDDNFHCCHFIFPTTLVAFNGCYPLLPPSGNNAIYFAIFATGI